MAVGGVSRNAVLFVLDLDDAHFNHSKDEVVWLGGEKLWIDLYSELTQELNRHNIDALFSVVTNKQNFDDVCAEAAKKLKPFLALHNQHTYSEDGKWVLTNYDNKMQFEYIDDDKSDINVPPDYFSHFVVLPYGCKSAPILEIAKKHGIVSSHCILIDDNPDVLLNAHAKGITILPLVEFHEQYDDRRLDDKEYVEGVLAKAKYKLKEIVSGIVDAIKEKKNYHQNFAYGELDLLKSVREKMKTAFALLPMWKQLQMNAQAEKYEARFSTEVLKESLKQIEEKTHSCYKK